MIRPSFYQSISIWFVYRDSVRAEIISIVFCNMFVILNIFAIGESRDIKTARVGDTCVWDIRMVCLRVYIFVSHLYLASAELVQMPNVPKKIDDPCKNLPDGSYAIRDVAKYLYCHFHHGHTFSCRSKQIFVPGINKCVPIGSVNPSKYDRSRHLVSSPRRSVQNKIFTNIDLRRQAMIAVVFLQIKIQGSSILIKRDYFCTKIN